MVEKKKKPAKKKTAKKKPAKKAAAKNRKKTSAEKTAPKTAKKAPTKIAAAPTGENGKKAVQKNKDRLTKAKRPELDWMMWRIDNAQRNDPPYLNLVRAIAYYNHKYGQVPNRCEVALDWGENMITPEDMILTHSKSIQPHHLMLAVDPSLNTLPIKRPTK